MCMQIAISTSHSPDVASAAQSVEEVCLIIIVKTGVKNSLKAASAQVECSPIPLAGYIHGIYQPELQPSFDAGNQINITSNQVQKASQETGCGSNRDLDKPGVVEPGVKLHVSQNWAGGVDKRTLYVSRGSFNTTQEVLPTLLCGCKMCVGIAELPDDSKP